MNSHDEDSKKEELIPMIPFIFILLKESWHLWLAFVLTLLVWLNPITLITPKWMYTFFLCFQILVLIENFLYILGSIEFSEDGKAIKYVREIRYINRPESKFVRGLFFLVCKPLGLFCSLLIMSLLGGFVVHFFDFPQNATTTDPTFFTVVLYLSWPISIVFAMIWERVIRKVEFREETLAENPNKGEKNDLI